MRSLIVTIDGTAGSGKTTIGQKLAQRLGLEFLHTGTMYRGLTALCLDSGIDPSTQREAAMDLARRCVMRFDWRRSPPVFSIGVSGTSHDNGNVREVTDRLNDQDVAIKVSDIAAMPQVRQVMVEAQRRIGTEHPRLVTEGRDQGAIVFPDAQIKFFVSARPEVRARRRAEQLRLAGKPVDESVLLRQINDRDHRDLNNPHGGLVKPASACEIDTSSLSIDQVVDAMVRQVHARGLS